jgi:hypothetical protein
MDETNLVFYYTSMMYIHQGSHGIPQYTIPERKNHGVNTHILASAAKKAP